LEKFLKISKGGIVDEVERANYVLTISHDQNIYSGAEKITWEKLLSLIMGEEPQPQSVAKKKLNDSDTIADVPLSIPTKRRKTSKK